jgi:CheY-like chemotaxis protein
MSHELRTPLNSLLILSDQLCKNPDGNLAPKQVEFAKTIHASGNDLLTLINDILDLSKIESGTVVMDPSDVRLDELSRYVERTFRHVAEAKGVDFFVRVDPRLPPTMFADLKRLQQVLKNLLSNAFKFTHQGSVTLTIDPATSGWDPDNDGLNRASDVVAISVRDTGIGISPDKQQIIFEAFQQADGSTSRKYGGTGLGLAISRELTRLLGGEIRLKSVPRSGSTFTLFVPLTYTPQRSLRKPAIERPPQPEAAARIVNGNAAPAARVVEVPPMPIGDVGSRRAPPKAPADPQGQGANGHRDVENDIRDDRESIAPGDRVLLIVENEPGFARLLLDAARAKGFKGIVTSSGVSALALASEYVPAAVTLDIFLPDM